MLESGQQLRCGTGVTQAEQDAHDVGRYPRTASAGQVAASVERHLNAPRPVALSGAATQVLTIVAYRQPVSQAGIESVRGTSSDSAIGTLLQRQLIALDDHRLFTTTAGFLKYLGLRDLADLPPLPELEQDRSASGG
jgi:segregation and condensation protein B